MQNSSTHNRHVISIDPISIMFTFGVILFLYFLYEVQLILVVLFLAFIFMSALNPTVKWLERKLRFPKIAAILSLYILFIGLVGLLGALILPPLIQELPNLVNTFNWLPLPQEITSLPQRLSDLPGELRDLKFTFNDINSMLPQFRSAMDTIISVASSTFNGIFTFFTTLVLTLYLLIERDDLHKKVVWVTRDKRHMKLAEEFLSNVERNLGGWVRGQVSLMFIIGLITYIGLSLMGIPSAMPLALAAGFLEVLPNLGPTLAAIPAVIIALANNDPATAGFVVLFYIIVQQFENNLIVPKIMKDNVDVNPLVTILLILVGLKLGSVIGAILAVPIYIVLRALYSLWLSEKHAVAEQKKKHEQELATAATSAP